MNNNTSIKHKCISSACAIFAVNLDMQVNVYLPNVLQIRRVRYCTYMQFKIKILNKRIIYLYNDIYKQHLPTKILPCR